MIICVNTGAHEPAKGRQRSGLLCYFHAYICLNCESLSIMCYISSTVYVKDMEAEGQGKGHKEGGKISKEGNRVQNPKAEGTRLRCLSYSR